MRITGLFAGIGGLEAGLADAGHKADLLCEIWDPARAVLSTRFSDVDLWRDVRDLPDLPGTTEVLVAGFPCQDLSQAGLTAGIVGRRSGLVGHVFRLLDRQSVPWVILENVSFMLQLDKGRGMRTLVEAFEERGYRWAYRVVNSRAFVPQRRERVVVIATLEDVDPASVLCVDDVPAPEIPTSLDTHAHGFYWTEGIRGLGWASDAIPTLKNGSTVGIASPPAILLPNGAVVTPDIRDAERLQGLESDWTEPAEAVARRSIRWSLVGNAVTRPVAAWLGARLHSPGEYDQGRDRDLPSDGRWPRSARFDGTHRHRIEIGAYPVWCDREPLAEFLKFSGKPLSVRATRGFLSRTERSLLRFVPGFRERVRAHLDCIERAGAHASAMAAE
ncbi:DNA cytosine methyltransferase [Pinisolibacter aquiterrae]|uniref:DNA cytosine methyltransferase n=1 Tax=Pinisolibacter aquiterrae TaxID=2815579 RepID=UPI001C3CEE16|nr:DNA (cytosine-5-)-methyltransferase [Pinisolibacter aquiterrae]MBV5262901.1 DNA (cytosine-5-)-methyltransferase [Pinisolibacter aquiterrae]MCC8235748.1 DNA (cytosine-5-)-methyltransferase [Pinisolibacter aquiterrae]